MFACDTQSSRKCDGRCYSNGHTYSCRRCCCLVFVVWMCVEDTSWLVFGGVTVNVLVVFVEGNFKVRSLCVWWCGQSSREPVEAHQIDRRMSHEKRQVLSSGQFFVVKLISPKFQVKCEK